jgi:hypothetical protein
MASPERRIFVAARVDFEGMPEGGTIDDLLLDNAEFAISLRMSERIRVPGGIKEAYERWALGPTRDERVRRLAGRGAGTDAIAASVGLSRRQVQRILYRES